MSILSLLSKKLLVLAPFFKTYIRDQTVLIRPHFDNVNVLVPIPRFSKLVSSLPTIGHNFDFIRQATTSYTENNCNLIFSKFFTLPIEAIRKRNCHLAAKSCSHTLASNAMAFDLIHAHFIELGYLGGLLKEKQGTPFVLTAHGTDVYETPFRNSWYNSLAKFILRKADYIITVSQFNSEKLLKLGVSSNKICVIPNGYDDVLFKPVSSLYMRQKLGLPINKKILLSVGNLIDEKGHVYLIDAMCSVLKKYPNVLLVVVGSGPLKKQLQKKVDYLGLNSQILFVGSRSHNEIPIWMNASDFFILPSIAEGLPTVIPEAMACGKPVISTCVGGIPEILSNSDLGIIVNPKNHQELSEAILNALNIKWDNEFISDYSKRYSWDYLVKQILQVYTVLLNR